MSQRTTRRLTTAAALAATLALTAPASAAAAERSPFGNLWQWLEGLLPQGIAALWTPREGGPEEAEIGRARTEKSGCTDPDGCSATQSNSLGGPTCRAWDEAGGCIDPDG